MSDLNLDLAPVAPSKALGGVPVIDISAPREGVVREIAGACRDWGFFQVSGHGVPESVMTGTLAVARAFFTLPREAKRAYLRSVDNPWGDYDRELTKNARDKKEVFDIGPDALGLQPGEDAFKGSTRWPDEPPRFRSAIHAYVSAADRVSMLLLEAIGEGLGASGAITAAFRPTHSSFLRLNHYTVQDPMAGEQSDQAGLGVHHHSDAGALTFLWQSDTAGLQVYRDGYWFDIPPIRDAFVINIGDMVQVWSNDLYVAPQHRVLAMESVDRFSFPYFCNPSYDTLVEPLGSGTPHYRPLDWGEFRRRRADGDFADYGAEVQISEWRVPGGA
jgi:isopenicillin N synthase-like dioxygenase